MKEVFTEIGIGNFSFINTQINTGKEEERVIGFVPMNLKAIYFRFYLGWITFGMTLPSLRFRPHKKQAILELGEIRITLKKKFRIKILFGLWGTKKDK
ncbi:MAG: hypothetical protein JXR30_00770 [Alphaproteobacteria bacterium]|nr:hypothetical protein [Alphaproteobacteria bacterium]